MWTIQFEDSAFGVGSVEEGFAFGETDEQAIETDAIELAGDAVAELVSDSDEIVSEGETLSAGDAPMVLDVGGGLGEVKGWDVVAEVNALVEGFKVLEL